jgi:hypothetical protein
MHTINPGPFGGHQLARTLTPWQLLLSTLSLFLFSASSLRGDTWEAEVLPVELTVGYAVRAVDVSGDGKLDIVIVDSKRVIWLENPTWQVHVIQATPEARADNVCMAPYDIDGDGDIDLALGADWQPNQTHEGGSVGWLEAPADPRQSWPYHPILSHPTTHRMTWGQWDPSDKKPSLIVAPLKGVDSTAPAWDDRPVELFALSIPSDPKGDRWVKQTIDRSLHVMHNLQFIARDEGASERATGALIVASYEGVHAIGWDESSRSFVKRLLGVGQQDRPPAAGSSEVRLGRLSDGRRFLATIEPWHGNTVVVYAPPIDSPAGDEVADDLWSGQAPWPRQVIDQELNWGHAVVCFNADDDADDELAVGVRDDHSALRCGVRVYDRDSSGFWRRRAIAPGEVAVEDMIAANLDADPMLELIAVGRATHNAIIYHHQP